VGGLGTLMVVGVCAAFSPALAEVTGMRVRISTRVAHALLRAESRLFSTPLRAEGTRASRMSADAGQTHKCVGHIGAGLRKAGIVYAKPVLTTEWRLTIHYCILARSRSRDRSATDPIPAR